MGPEWPFSSTWRERQKKSSEVKYKMTQNIIKISQGEQNHLILGQLYKMTII